MQRNRPNQILNLQQNPSNIRNICILAHVDHGKTTLADSLVASNGIISHRLAGKMRYMDSREDEQVRGITMKSSAISLLYTEDEKEYLINLIDSPGHVDFSSEVSTAVRLCDGALLIVDVVEGVCPQTHAVLRQAWLENIKPLLILNKIDRLIIELKLSASEAYIHLQQLLEQVNLLTNELYTSEAMEKTSAVVDENDEDGSHLYDWTTLEDIETEKNIFFSPDRGNVIFASALDGWAFTVSHFAEIYSKKLNFNKDVLNKTLWGDFYLNMKSKSIQKGAQSKGKKALFVQLVLDNIWAMYDAIYIKRDQEMIEKIQKSLDLKISARDSRHTDARVQLQAHTMQWLPISKAVLAMVCDILPSPLQMSEERVEKLMCGQAKRFDSLPPSTQALKSNFISCNRSEDSPVIVFVSKMFPVDRKMLPVNKSKPFTKEELHMRREKAIQRHAEKLKNLIIENETTNDEITNLPEHLSANEDTENNISDQVFIAFARIYSGTIRKGQTLYVLGPKYSPSKTIHGDVDPDLTLKDLSSDEHVTSIVVNDLYLFMGRELEAMDEIPAGNVLGIGSLEDHVLKSATISSSLYCPPFTSMYFDASPIVRVAIEPAQACNMKAVREGLKLLNQADPCVVVCVQETGEHVIVTAGEVHLQRCLDDLKERYAKVEICASDPIVPFRETVTFPPKIDMVNEAIQDEAKLLKSFRLKQFEDDEEVKGEGVVEIWTPDKSSFLRINCVPLPLSVTKLLVENSDLIKALNQTHLEEKLTDNTLNTTTLQNLRDFKTQLEKTFNEDNKFWKEAHKLIWSFGPRRTGPNILLNRIVDYNRPSIWNCLEHDINSNASLRDLDSAVIHGFQMATLAGPMCEEPMHGVCFIIDKWENINTCALLNRGVDSRDGSKESIIKRQEVYGPLSGQIMSIVKDGCRKAFQTQPQRLVAAMYKCEIQATADVLGKLYEVLGKRNGSVLSEEMKEGTQLFIVEATLPVVESFGFAEEMRKRTSGLASPQLKFSHWEIIDVDPFWVPTTEEEYLHYGEKADNQNRALTYLNNVRKRKGLKVEEKIVEHGEKQRTLTRNK